MNPQNENERRFFETLTKISGVVLNKKFVCIHVFTSPDKSIQVVVNRS